VKEKTEAELLTALCNVLFGPLSTEAQTALVAYLTEWNRIAGMIGTVETPSVAAAELVALQPVVIDAALRVGCLLALLDQPALPPLSKSQPFKEWLRGKLPEKRGKSKRDSVAEQVGVDERTLDGWLDDEHAPNRENLEKLAKVLADFEATPVSPFAELKAGLSDRSDTPPSSWWLKLVKIVDRIIAERAPVALPMKTRLTLAFAARRLARALEERFGTQIYLSISEQFLRIANAVAAASRQSPLGGRGGETDVLFIGAMGRGTSLPRLAVILEELAANEADPVWRTALREFMTPSARCDLRARLHAQSLLAASDATSTEDAEDRFYLAYLASADLGIPSEKLREGLNLLRDAPGVPKVVRDWAVDELDGRTEAFRRELRALLAERRHDVAITELTRALSTSSTCVWLLLDRGSVFEAQGEFASALADYEAVLAEDEKHAEALDRAAHLYFVRGNRKRAKEFAKRAYELGRMTIHSAACGGYYRRSPALRPPPCETDPPFFAIAFRSVELNAASPRAGAAGGVTSRLDLARRASPQPIAKRRQ
jgi:tetratricopeptide (TPR) repeat protein